MTEPDVTLTDYALFLLCSFFSWSLKRQVSSNKNIRFLWVIFFASVALASLTGGTVHGFFLDGTSLGFRFLWPVTLILIGISASTVWILAGLLLTGRENLNVWKAFSGITFIIYVAAVLFYSQSFTLVILNYLPAMLVLLAAAFWTYLRDRSRPHLIICLGIILSLLAAGAQQAHFALHPVYFNHNSTYHLIQAFGLVVLFHAAKNWMTSERI